MDKYSLYVQLRHRTSTVICTSKVQIVFEFEQRISKVVKYSHYQKFKTTLNFKTKLTKLNSKLHKG